ncbi:MAG TPA: helix-turn-helix domain-containing protein [Pseudonocardia sp.]|jgi:TetR/AcrR family transcriptional repressor of lmrAB and yxaGH operons|uniref:TetR/AcrR family transcriptional regulator n=1 Tax=Pseudonocardia sp. Cha107L01 TaxID=3457576 RepID=UPI0028CAE407|nr:TetR/AcrR family transcriptional regulator, lmrAB and yxaGH operons repressor [Pseudonocardiales bacterium]MDT7750963.1 TetR/AcrR family transcriptional regulator, lmrAB and yxaGH operons repressor [Pseudonocardiales bacterium]
MPRPQSVHDDELLARLAEVFRMAGFEGASLGALAEAAQLRRASLYHRFPQGKAQMAEAVLDRVEVLFDDVLEPMRTEADVTAGVTETARRIGGFYGGGLLPCVLDTLTLAGTPDAVRARAAGVARVWIDAMAAAAVRAGRPEESARASAEDAFVHIEGGLVFGRLFGDPAAFRRALADLPRLLLDEH